MVERYTDVEYHPIVGQPSKHAEERCVVVFDTETGVHIGESPHVKVEQSSLKKSKGVITMRLQLTPPVKDS